MTPFFISAFESPAYEGFGIKTMRQCKYIIPAVRGSTKRKIHGEIQVAS